MPADTFEVRFSKLVNNQLSTKIPSMMRYRIGFQLIDKNEEETRAVGVTGFIIGKYWCYVPSFFIEGDLKGDCLLYIKQSDMFVPARDNWVSTLKENPGDFLGRIASDNEIEKANGPEDVTIDGLNGLTNKTASEYIIDRYTLAKMRKSAEDIKCNIFEKIAALGDHASKLFVKTVTEEPEFAATMFKFYSADDLRGFGKMLAKTAAENETENSAQENKVSVYDIKSDVSNLTDSEKKIIVKEGLFIKDDRETLSKVFAVNGGISLETPNETGEYEILMADNKMRNAYIICGRGITGNTGNMVPACERLGQSYGTYVVFKNAPTVCHHVPDCSGIFARKVKKGELPESKVTISKLLSSGENKTINCLIYKDGSVHEVYMYGASAIGDSISDGYATLTLTGKPGKLHLSNNTLYVPEDACMFVHATGKQRAAATFADLNCIYQNLILNNGFVPLELANDKETFEVTVGADTFNMDKTAALMYLTNDLGIYAGQSRDLLNSAKENKRAKYLLKIAAEYGIKGGASVTNETPDNVDTQLEVGGKGVEALPEDIIRKATAASDAGIKDVFDISTLKGLVKAADISALRNDYIKDIAKGMDRYGRLLYILYWNRDSFKDRYGDSDIKQLEDSLKQVFIDSGDVILFLKDKSAYSPEYTMDHGDTLQEADSLEF